MAVATRLEVERAELKQPVYETRAADVRADLVEATE